MRFNDLDLETKTQLNKQLTQYSNSIGGMNFFLQMIEDVRNEKPSSLLSKEASYTYKQGKITWTKSIFKETLTLLFSAMRKEEKDGEKVTRREFSYQSFQRTFTVPENVVNAEKIAAKYADGILHVTLPKVEEVKPKPAKQIAIK